MKKVAEAVPIAEPARESTPSVDRALRSETREQALRALARTRQRVHALDEDMTDLPPPKVDHLRVYPCPDPACAGTLHIFGVVSLGYAAGCDCCGAVYRRR